MVPRSLVTWWVVAGTRFPEEVPDALNQVDLNGQQAPKGMATTHCTKQFAQTAKKSKDQNGPREEKQPRSNQVMSCLHEVCWLATSPFI